MGGGGAGKREEATGVPYIQQCVRAAVRACSLVLRTGDVQEPEVGRKEEGSSKEGER